MKTIQEFLSMNRPTMVRPRFDFAIPETIEDDLKGCYQAAVESYGRKFEENSETDRVIRSVSNWFRSGKPGLLLIGKCGTGKSIMLHAIALLVKFYYSERVEMKIHSTAEVCELSRKVEKKTDEEKFILERIKTFRYLGLDDFGTEALTVKSWGTELSPILDTLYARYDHRRVTVITTNDSLEKLQQKYGQRLYDRICEIYDRIPFNFKSFRQ